MLYLLRLEFLDSRYTRMMHETIVRIARECNIKVETVEGEDPKDGAIKTGKVLDAAGTIGFKASQIGKVAKLFDEGKIKAGDRFLLYDVQLGYAESIRYMSHLFKIPVGIFGILHACSVTTEDFSAPMKEWMWPFEVGWVKACDKIFVGSYYFYNKFINERRSWLLPEDINKITITGNVFSTKWLDDIVHNTPYHNDHFDVVFSNRFDPEKGAYELLHIAEQLPDVTFHIPSSRPHITLDPKLRITLESTIAVRNNISYREGLTQAEYYEDVKRSKIFLSLSHEENFGYCVVEAMTLGCIPICPDAFSYQELIPIYREQLLFSDLKGAKSRIKDVVEGKVEIRKIRQDLRRVAEKHNDNVYRILQEIMSWESPPFYIKNNWS